MASCSRGRQEEEDRESERETPSHAGHDDFIYTVYGPKKGPLKKVKKGSTSAILSLPYCSNDPIRRERKRESCLCPSHLPTGHSRAYRDLWGKKKGSKPLKEREREEKEYIQ